MPTGQEVADSTAVAGDDTIEAPLIAQDLLFVAGLRATRLTVYTLVGAHNLCHLSLLHQGLEGGEIGLPEVALGQILYIECMAVPFRPAVHGEVLGARQQLPIFFPQPLSIIGIALQSSHHRQTHLRSQEGIFAISLLTTSPAGITEDIDIRCPERETLVALDIPTALGLLSLHTCLVAHGRKHLMQQGIIPRGCHRHRDGEHRGIAVAPHTVQGFVPPLELRNTESRDGGRGVHHQ